MTQGSERGWEFDKFEFAYPAPDTSGMFSPVRCTWCHGVYDVGKVEVTARYADCRDSSEGGEN